MTSAYRTASASRNILRENSDPSWDAVGNAGFWRRFFAHFIDGIVLIIPSMVLTFFLGFILVLFTHPADTDANTDMRAIHLAFDFATFLLAWTYFAVFESSRLQATPGKLALGLRVTGTSGDRISFGRAAGRYLGKFLSAIPCFAGFIMAAFTQEKQALHDLLVSTFVIRQL